jgi:hypothetical protein
MRATVNKDGIDSIIRETGMHVLNTLFSGGVITSNGVPGSLSDIVVMTLQHTSITRNDTSVFGGLQPISKIVVLKDSRPTRIDG